MTYPWDQQEQVRINQIRQEEQTRQQQQADDNRRAQETLDRQTAIYVEQAESTTYWANQTANWEAEQKETERKRKIRDDTPGTIEPERKNSLYDDFPDLPLGKKVSGPVRPDFAPQREVSYRSDFTLGRSLELSPRLAPLPRPNFKSPLPQKAADSKQAEVDSKKSNGELSAAGAVGLALAFGFVLVLLNVLARWFNG